MERNEGLMIVEGVESGRVQAILRTEFPEIDWQMRTVDDVRRLTADAVAKVAMVVGVTGGDSNERLNEALLQIRRGGHRKPWANKENPGMPIGAMGTIYKFQGLPSVPNEGGGYDASPIDVVRVTEVGSTKYERLAAGIKWAIGARRGWLEEGREIFNGKLGLLNEALGNIIQKLENTGNLSEDSADLMQDILGAASLLKEFLDYVQDHSDNNSVLIDWPHYSNNRWGPFNSMLGLLKDEDDLPREQVEEVLEIADGMGEVFAEITTLTSRYLRPTDEKSMPVSLSIIA